MTEERTAWQSRYDRVSQRQENPLFPRRREAHARTVRHARAMLWTISALLLAGAGAFVFAEPLQLRYVTVDGVRYQTPGAVEQRMTEYLAGRSLGVLPRRSYALFSTAGAERYLRSHLPSSQALASVRITKQFPSLVHVGIEERTPNLVYVNGGTDYLMDRQGFIAQLPEPATEKAKKGKTKAANSSFPTLHDQNTRAVAVGQQMVSPQYVEALFTARDALLTAEIPVEFWYLPPVVCLPPPQTTAPRTNVNAAEQTNINGASNVNAKSPPGNRNASPQQKGSAPSNVNAGALPVPPCDVSVLASASRELRARTTEGWDVYLRTDEALDAQVQRVLIVIAEQQLERKKLRYIDVRFGDRVNYRNR